MKIKSLTVKLAALLCACGLAFSAQAANVAKIGEVEYATLSDAIAAAEGGDTVQLLADVEVSSSTTPSKTLTLDLNGYTITSSAILFNIYSSSVELTITDSSANGTGAIDVSANKIVYVSSGKFTLEGGALSVHSSSSHTYGVQVGSSGTFVMSGGSITIPSSSTSTFNYCVNNGGTTTITGGSMTAEASGGNYTISGTSGTIAISDGVFVAKAYPAGFKSPYVLYGSGTKTVTGGYFRAIGDSATYSAGYLIDGTATVSGGYFGGSYYYGLPSSSIDPSCQVVLNTDEATKTNYKFVVIPAVAQIGDTKYESLQEALNAAQAGDTVQLLADVEVSYSTTLDKTLTLDLNGKAITSSAILFNIYNSSVELTITDSSTNGTGAIDVSANKIVYVSSGKFTLEGGALSVHSSSSHTYGVHVGSSGTFVMSGGSITIPSSSTSTYNYCVSNSGTTTITGGSMTAEASGGNYTISGTGGTIAISDGVFVAKAYPAGFKSPYVLYGSGAKTVTGGYFRAIGDSATYSAGYLIDGTATVSGGYFGGSYYYGLPSSSIDPSCQVVLNTDEATKTNYKFVVIPAVAQIGDTKYPSLAAAILAAQSGDTVQMIADSVETAGGTVASGKTVTLDLNGKAISYTSTFGAAFNLIAVNGNLTVTDTSEGATGSIALTSTANLSWDYAVNMFLVGNGGSLTIEKGSYSVSTPSYGYAEYVIAASNNSGSSTVVINGGTFTGNNIDAVVRLHDQYNRANTTLNVTVNGGDFTLNGSQCDSVIWFDVQKSGSGTDNTSVANLVINGGTLTSTSNSPALDIGHDVDASGLSVTVNGGAFKSNGAVIKTRNLSEAAIANIQLSAGIYSGNVYYNDLTKETVDIGTLCTDGNTIVDNTDTETKDAYPYTVGVAVTYVAQIGDVKYETFAEAIAAANTAEIDEITILDNTTDSPDADWKVVDGKLVKKVYTAQIEGGAKFESLDAAVAAAQAGDTIKLLADIAYGTDREVPVWGKPVNIDLDGHTLTTLSEVSTTLGNQGYKAAALCFSIADPCNITIGNGTIVTAYGAGVYADDPGITLTLTNLTINAATKGTQSTAEYSAAVRVTYESKVIIESGTYSGAYSVAASNSGADITINGGTFKDDLFFSASTTSGKTKTITITGGEFLGGDFVNTNKGTLTISGGDFAKYIADATGYIVEGKTCTTKMMSNGLYRVVDAATVTFAAGTDAPSGATVPAAITYPSGDAAELALGVPGYTSADYTFGGWKMSDNKVVAALPAGTTGDQTLTATWVKATKIEVATDSTKPEETVEVKVTEEWVDANVTKADETATPAEIKAALEAKQDNNLTGLENYVLGLDGRDPNAKVKVDSEIGASETAVPVVNTLKQTVDTGFKVQYSLDKVSETGTTITEGTKQDTSDLSLDLTKVADTQDGVGYYKMTATITKEGVEGTVSKVSSENTIGVLAVKDAPATTIIGVPWKSLTEGNIKVDELVRTENLTEGDEIKVYDTTAGKYKAWTLNENKEWEEVATVSQETTEEPGAATGTTVARGAGVWLTRKNPSEPIYLMGQATADAVEKTPVEVPAEAGKEAWTLVASPKVEPVKVADVAAGEGDIIRLPTTGAPKDFKYRNGKWGYTEYYVDDNGLTRSRRVETDDKTTIPAGRGFWYINKSTDADKKIDWDKQTNQNN